MRTYKKNRLEKTNKNTKAKKVLKLITAVVFPIALISGVIGFTLSYFMEEQENVNAPKVANVVNPNVTQEEPDTILIFR